MASSPTRVHWRDARGLRFAALPDDPEVPVEDELVRWCARGSVDRGLPLKPGTVWKLGPLVVKLFPPPARWWKRLAGSPALRCARLAAAIRPIATPEPYIALESTRPRERWSLLVTAHVEGKSLADVWSEGGPTSEPMRALPDFLARMHRRGVWHGDLHAGNLLWDGSRWLLLDLGSLRHRGHRIRARRMAESQWARLFCGFWDEEAVRPLFARYLELSGRRWDRERSLRRIATDARALRNAFLAGRRTEPMPSPSAGALR